MRRTNAQNKSMHKIFRELALGWNEAGLTQDKVLSNPMMCEWNEHSVKDLFRSTANALYGKKGTSELDTKEVNEVYEHITRHLASLGYEMPPFPSVDNILDGYEEML